MRFTRFAVAVFLAHGDVAADDGRPRKDIAAVRAPSAIEGTWEVVAQELGGTVNRPPAGQCVCTFRGNRVTVAGMQGSQPARVDESRSPPWITFERGQGIWRVDGDILLIAVGTHGRPSSFAGHDPLRRTVVTHRRVAGR